MISLRSFVSVILLVSFFLVSIEAFQLDLGSGTFPYEKRYYPAQSMNDYIDAIRRGPFSGVPSFRNYVERRRD
ncbi:hypothetical protein GCK32_003991 [Trichostrongylus colubriformis]|uniref:Neuropeptide-Like Protein n=1 Tax=Trichostrongylus colubriformis TaxID=6319 RepID=A0AAN8I8Q7_TRICO